MSHINRRSGRWQAAYRGPDGRERTKTFDRKVDAERWLTAAEADLLRGTWVDPAEGRTTLEDYAARWLERMTPTWRASTAGAVRTSLEKHILPVLGRHRLSALRRTDVEALCARLDLAPSTVYVVYQHLYQVLSAAVEDGLLARNPAARARVPKREPSKAQPVPLEMVERIATELPNWMRVVVPLGVGAGLRQGQVCGLTVDRIDFARRRLRIDRQLVSRYVPEPVLGPVKTPSSNRTIPLATFVVEAMWAHLERFPAEPGQPIVRMPSGLWADSDRFGHPWRTASRRAGDRGLGLPRPAPHLRLDPAVPRRLGEGGGGLARSRLAEDHPRHLRPPHAGRRGGRSGRARRRPRPLRRAALGTAVRRLPRTLRGQGGPGTPADQGG